MFIYCLIFTVIQNVDLPNDILLSVILINLNLLMPFFRMPFPSVVQLDVIIPVLVLRMSWDAIMQNVIRLNVILQMSFCGMSF
jgi:hypothetical protein